MSQRFRYGVPAFLSHVAGAVAVALGAAESAGLITNRFRDGVVGLVMGLMFASVVGTAADIFRRRRRPAHAPVAALDAPGRPEVPAAPIVPLSDNTVVLSAILPAPPRPRNERRSEGRWSTVYRPRDADLRLQIFQGLSEEPPSDEVA